MLRAQLLGPLIFGPALLAAALQEAPPRPATANEKQVVAEMVKVRMHPKEYVRWLQEQGGYFEGVVWHLPGRVPIRTEEGDTAVQELIAFLEHTPSAGPLRWSEGLSRAARQLVMAQGPTAGTGHVGPDGSTLQSRTLKHGLFLSRIGEVINYGAQSPRWTVLELLIDDGVPGRAHRNAIFDPAFHLAGAATGPHAGYGEMTVVDLADGFTENP